MKKLHFSYHMHSAFDGPVTAHSFTLRCFPKSNELQKIVRIKKEILPADWLCDAVDSFGNDYIYGKTERRHDSFFVQVEGETRICRTEGQGLCGSCPPGGRYPTKLTLCSKEMCCFAAKFQKKWYKGGRRTGAFRDMIYDLMEKIYHYMLYTPGSTHTRTAAQEAFAMGKGVCQDYAHIMIALCRKLSIPAAYVAGFMCGEGASHAWVAVGDEETNLWYEIDPTNCRWVDETYIMVSHGMDAADCIMNKGIYRGVAAETQSVTVIVEEII